MEDTIKLSFFILMLLVSYYLGNKIAQYHLFNFLVTRKNRYGAIDGLRGYLAISIFVHHFILTWYWKNTGHWYRPQELYFQNIGIIGVMIFFMITGYLFTSKILSDKGKINWIQLYKSRLFRIYPLYLFVILIITLIIFSQPQYQEHLNIITLLKQYAQWILFHGNTIHTHPHTPLIIAGVDWTLKYEWLFYLSLPLIAGILFLNKWLSLLLAVIAIYYFSFDYKIYNYQTIHLLFFIIGGITAHLYLQEHFLSHIFTHKITSIFAIISLVSSLFFSNIYTPIPIILISFFFIAIAMGNTLFGLFEQPSSLLLGEISYSIYLIHGAIIYILFTLFHIIDLKSISSQQHTYMLPILIILIIFIATFTYLYIEKPGIALGKRNLNKA